MLRDAYNDRSRMGCVDENRLLMGLAAVLAGLTVTVIALGFAVSLFLLPLAIPFGGAAYLFWYHASGRLMADARENARTYRVGGTAGPAADGRGGFGGAGGPFSEATARERVRSNRRDARTGAPRTTVTMSPEKASRVLDVSVEATEAEIKTAYRQKVKKSHPDTDGGNEEAFKRVNRAYDTLRER